MKTKTIFNGMTITSMLVSLLTPLAILVPKVSAATDICTWTGGGADKNFATTGNWNCSVDGAAAVPENGDSLQFDMSTATAYSSDDILNNNLTGLSITGIDLTGGNGSGYGYRIEGNGITLTGNITGDQTDGDVTLALDVTLAADVVYSVPKSAIRFGVYDTPYSLDIGSNQLTYSAPFGVCSDLNVYSSLSGSGNILSTPGSSYISLVKAETGFTGDITINGSGLSLYPDTMLGFDSTITMNGSSSLSLISNDNYTYDIAEVVMNSSADAAIFANYFKQNSCGGGGTPDKATTTLTGKLTLMRDTVFSGADDLIVEGVYKSNGHILTTKTGSVGAITTSDGTVETQKKTTTIDAADKSTASLNVGNKETTILNGERGSVAVADGGILKGNGRASSIDINKGGILAPGLSPGCIEVTSGTLNLAGVYQVEIAGNTACTEYDQTNVTGGVVLQGNQLTDLPTLDVSMLNKFTPKLNDTFIIINNDAAESVTGTFEGLANGATFVVNGITFRINYDGGDGNDVVLTAVSIPAVPDTGAQELLTNPLTTLLAGLVAMILLGGYKLSSRKSK